MLQKAYTLMICLLTSISHFRWVILAGGSNPFIHAGFQFARCLVPRGHYSPQSTP